MKPVRIVLADDHEMIREGLRGLIEAQPDLSVVGEASDGQGALEQIEALCPDLLLLDVSMPKCSGVQLMERLRGKRGAPRVLVLTAYADIAYLNQMLASGAAGYLLKQSASKDLIEAIHNVMGGAMYLDRAVVGTVASGFLERKKLPGLREGDELTQRQREVLRQMAQGYSNKEIAARLGISVKTVEAHKANFMDKLALRNRAQIVRYARLQGWLEE